MNVDPSTVPDGGSEAVAAAAVTPKNDAEAAAIEQQPAPTPNPDDAAKAEAERAEGERKRNRTSRYIERLQAERAEMARELAELRARQQSAAPQNAPRQTARDSGPKLEDFNYDLDAYQAARDAYVIEQARTGFTEQQQQAEAQRRERETWTTYEQRVAEFADEHPDFLEVVGSIAYPLPLELQAVIAAHPQGPQLAYHLGNNDDEAFQLASIQPHLAAAAVDRLAARLSAAPPASTQPVAPAAPPAKPISQAPPPPPTVGARATTETPAEKLTDDQWYERERAKRRKR